MRPSCCRCQLRSMRTAHVSPHEPLCRKPSARFPTGAPKFGWHDTLCYLTLPILLVISQYASTQLLTPKSDDPAQQQSQAILKFLPLMIGWFSLNVPSGLGLYWITNNVVTTATTLLIRPAEAAPRRRRGPPARGPQVHVSAAVRCLLRRSSPLKSRAIAAVRPH